MKAFALTLLIATTACQSWQIEDKQQFAKDNYTCLRESRKTVAGSTSVHVTTRRGGFWGGFASGLKASDQGPKTVQDNTLYEACMKARGYKRN